MCATNNTVAVTIDFLTDAAVHGLHLSQSASEQLLPNQRRYQLLADGSRADWQLRLIASDGGNMNGGE